MNRPWIVIEPPRGWAALGLKEVWEYHELLVLMVWREIQGAYRQTALGMSWLLLRPVISMVVFTAVFGGLMKVPSENVPYALFSLSALLPWTFFSQGVARAAGSLVLNTQIVSKVYFPRLVLPLAGTLSGLVDFAASLVIFALMMVYYRQPLRLEVLWIPVFLLVAVLFSLAIGLWLATLSVKYRDVQFAINYLLQIMMYASPVIYSVSLVPEKLRFLYQLNPMTSIIEGFRWALLGIGQPPGAVFLLNLTIILAALVSGAFVFSSAERTIVDVL